MSLFFLLFTSSHSLSMGNFVQHKCKHFFILAQFRTHASLASVHGTTQTFPQHMIAHCSLNIRVSYRGQRSDWYFKAPVCIALHRVMSLINPINMAGLTVFLLHQAFASVQLSLPVIIEDSAPPQQTFWSYNTKYPNHHQKMCFGLLNTAKKRQTKRKYTETMQQHWIKSAWIIMPWHSYMESELLLANIMPHALWLLYWLPAGLI